MTVTHILKTVAQDRAFMASWFVLMLVCVFTTILFLFRIHPTELNTQIRYTAFGVTHIYSNAWYYLLPMVLFNLTILVAHSAIAGKLFIEKSKYIARLFIWLSIAIVLIATCIAMGVLGLAAI